MENIKINIEDLEEPISKSNSNTNLSTIDDLQESFNEDFFFYAQPSNIESDIAMSQFFYYDENFTVKELIKICEYYSLMSRNKLLKTKKLDIISMIVDFESNPINEYIVVKRQMLWNNINELKKDSYMSKYIVNW